MGLQPLPSDPAVYVLHKKKGILLIHLHVDNSLVFCKSASVLDGFINFLNSIFEIKWTHSPLLYLGIKIKYDATQQTCSIFQAHYIKNLLNRFKLAKCNTVRTPLPPKTMLDSGKPDKFTAAKDLPYQQLVGCFPWVSSLTQPDIAHAVSQLSRFNAAWTDVHWSQAKQVLRYLKGTKTLKITFSRQISTPNTPVIYSDTDFSQFLETSRSVTGYLIRTNGGIVTWNSQHQPVVAQFTSEAEYISASDACQHLSWTKSFWFDIFLLVKSPIVFNIKSTSAISITTEDAIKKRPRHIDRKYRHIHEKYEAGAINTVHVPTHEMLANFLTKPLGRVELEKARLDNGIV